MQQFTEHDRHFEMTVARRDASAALINQQHIRRGAAASAIASASPASKVPRSSPSALGAGTDSTTSHPSWKAASVVSRAAT